MKYEICQEAENTVTNWDGTKNHRIRATNDFTCQGREVKSGELGGWISEESSLSHEGECWIFSGLLWGNARLEGDSYIERARVGSGATDRPLVVKGSSKIVDSSIGGYVHIEDSSIVGCQFSGADTFINDSALENMQVSGPAKYKISLRKVTAGKDWNISSEYGNVTLREINLPAPPYGETYLRGSGIELWSDTLFDFVPNTGGTKLDNDVLWASSLFGPVYMGNRTAESAAWIVPSCPEWCYRERAPENFSRHERRIWEQGMEVRRDILAAIQKIKNKQLLYTQE